MGLIDEVIVIGWTDSDFKISRALLHTMGKTSVKFQNDWPKTEGGVALTRHPLTIRVLGKHETPTDYKGFR